MPDNLELALALRELVLAVERYRASKGQEVLYVSGTDLVTLGILYTSGPQTSSELARALGFSTASTTDLVDRLEAAGLTRRDSHPTDRRKRFITLTPAASRGLAGIYGQLGDLVAPAWEAAGPEAVSGFLRQATAALNHVIDTNGTEARRQRAGPRKAASTAPAANRRARVVPNLRHPRTTKPN